MKKSVLAGLSGLLSMFMPGRGQAVSIPSHEIDQPEAQMQLSKRAMQKKNGKKARQNRGKRRSE